LLAAFLAVKHFRFFLEGRPFTLFTDHKPLVSALSKQSTPFSSSHPTNNATFLSFPNLNPLLSIFPANTTS
jgi:hypothetical protein